jgi:hypothetical protein
MTDALTSPGSRRTIVALAAGSGALLAAALVLWAKYGSAVFYEMILAGFAACF